MNRRHVFGCCLMVLQFLSCGLYSQNTTQNIDADALKKVVKKYLQSVQQGDYAEALALSTFRDDDEKAVFQGRLKKRGPIQMWDLEQDIHVVKTTWNNGNVQAILLVPTEQGFLPDKFTFREDKGQLKLVQDSCEKADGSQLDVVSAKVAELKESKKGWESAHGAPLGEMTHALKERLLDEIVALEYAKTNKLQIATGYGDLAIRRRTYKDVMALSDEDLRVKMVKEIQFALEALSP